MTTIRALHYFAVAATLLLPISGCKLNDRKATKHYVVPGVVDLADVDNNERPYSWMSDEELEQYKLLKVDTVWQDSLSSILSNRLGKLVHMDDFLKMTYSDGESIYYWNHHWGDVSLIPSGFDVSEQTNWFWKVPNGACFTGALNGCDSVSVYISASHQTEYMDDRDFTESYMQGVLANRQFDNVRHSFKRGEIVDDQGQHHTYLFCSYEGKNNQTGKGEFHKEIRALPGSNGSFAMTIEYPIPKSSDVQELINSLSSYPNITYSSQYGDEIH